MIVRVNLFLPTKGEFMRLLFKLFNKLKKLFFHQHTPTTSSNITIEEGEHWVKVDEYPEYLVSNTGKIKNKFGKLLKGAINKKGYATIGLTNKNNERIFTRVHRIVAMGFIPNPNNYPDVNHIDGNKLNNKASNLEWCTKKQNIEHARKIGLSPLRYGTSNPYSVLNKQQVKYILTHYKPKDKKFGARALARNFGVHHKTVLDVINKKRYVINGEYTDVQK